MRVKALRGVCIGVERHMMPGDIEDLDAATVTFLVGIGAVELVTEPPPVAAARELDLKSEPDPKPDAGKGKGKDK